MSSILSFPERGPWGNASYRGNCSGHVYRSLFEMLRPRSFCDPMAGSGTSVEVARELGIVAHGLDLREGFNALRHSILCAIGGEQVDACISHVPYGPMIVYSGEVWGTQAHPDDLSRCADDEDFHEKLQVVLLNQRAAARPGGYSGTIIGDRRQGGRYVSYQAEAIARIDMSEYMEQHSVARLIGAPPGYVGYEEGGQLTERVRRRPYSVILLDEIEKAHRDVFNVLLQVLDDGRLTDGHGRTVDFRNTIVVMTSNLGSDRIQELAGQPYDTIKAAVMDVLRHQFRPEFINRIDETVVFHALGREQLRRIVDIQIGALRARLAERDMTISFTDQALDWLANVGFDPVYGARPLKRAIQQHVENALARDLLGGKLADGDSIQVDVSGDGLVFKKQELNEAVA